MRAVRNRSPMRPVPPPPSLPAAARKPLMSSCAAALLALVLCACSPRYDWRTIQSGEGGYAALYPGKPTSAARDVTIAGRKLPMTMEAARVDDTLFAVGVVTLPADDPELRREALAAMQAGLLANLGTPSGEPARTRPVTIMTADRPGRPLEGVEVQASGVSPQDQSPRRLTARLVAVGIRAYQAVVLEAGDAARDLRQAEQVEQFLTGFHPL
ncbi:membrane protein [Ralstonia pickettii DTP0602]|nr:membrane protein [Ralstonia pickettii DTP0602]